MQNRILSSGSSFSDSDGNNSLDQSHIQQIFNLKNQFLQANTTMELQNTSVIKGPSSRVSVRNQYQEQLGILSEQIKQMKLQHQDEIQRKEAQMLEMENRFQSVLMRERQSVDSDELRKAVERYNKVTEEQQSKTEQLKMKLAEKQHEYNLLKESFDKEQRNNVALKEELLQLRIENRQIENQFQLTKSELQQKQQGYTQYEDVLNDNLKRAKDKLQKCESDLIFQQNKVNQLQVEYTTAESQRHTLAHRCQIMENENQQLKNKIHEYQNEIGQMQHHINDLNSRFLERERQWHEKELQSEDIRLSATGLHQKIQMMEIQIIDQKKEINSLTQDKHELAQNLKQLRDAVFGSTVKFDPQSKTDLTADLKQMENYVQNLREEKFQFEEMLMESKQMVISLEQELSRSKHEKDELLHKLNLAKSEHERELNELRLYAHQSNDQQKEINQLRLQVREAVFKQEQVSDNYENRLREKDLQIQSLQVQLQIFDKDYQSLSTRIEEDLKAKMEERISIVQVNVNQQKEAQLREYTQRIKLLEEEHQRMREQHERTVEHLKQQYQQRQSETMNNNWRIKETELAAALQEKELMLDLEKKQIRLLQEQLAGYENLEQRESLRIKDRQALLERDLFEANRQKAQLICQVSKLQKELDHYIGNIQKQSDDTIYKRENEKLHQMIDRLTDQLMNAEELAQNEQRNSLQTRSQLDLLMKEREQLRQHSQSTEVVQTLSQQLKQIQAQLKHTTLLSEEYREEKNRTQRLYNELQNDHEQLYQQYKAKEAEAFELNKLYVELLQGQTDRQTNAARQIQQLQSQIEQLRQELKDKESTIIRQLEDKHSRVGTHNQMQYNNHQGHIDLVMSPGFNNHKQPTQQVSPSPLIAQQQAMDQGQGANRMVLVQIYQIQIIEQLRLKLKDLKTQIFEKLNHYQDLIKKKQRSQTKQTIHQDLQNFREQLINVFETAQLTSSQKEQIFFGAMIQIKYADLRVQEDINQQILNIVTFIESFNQLVAKTTDKSVEQSQINKKQVAKHKIQKQFTILKTLLQGAIRPQEIQHLVSLFNQIENDESSAQRLVTILDEAVMQDFPNQQQAQESLQKLKKLILYVKRH